MIKRKLSLFSILMTVILSSTVLGGCASTTKTATTTPLTTVRLNEVARSVFYAPFYAAMNLGYFKDQGLTIDLTTGKSADKTML